MPSPSISLLVSGSLLLVLSAHGAAGSRPASAPAPPAGAAEIPACPRFDVPDDTVVTVSRDRPDVRLRDTATLWFSPSTLPSSEARYRITRSPGGRQRAEIGINPASDNAPIQFDRAVQVEISYRDCRWRVPAHKRVVVLRTDLPTPDSIGGTDDRSRQAVRFSTTHFTDFALAIP